MQAEKQASLVQPSADGRHLRSTRSRAKIIGVMLKLVRAGNYAPSAADIAKTAKVSLRTVFRHFDDLDALYREIAQHLEGELRPLLAARETGGSWPERLFEQVERRVVVYENVLPIRLAADARRYHSPFLKVAYEQFHELERSGLACVLPDHIVDDPAWFAAVRAVSSFGAWRHLRNDQEKSVDEAREAVVLMVSRIVGEDLTRR